MPVIVAGGGQVISAAVSGDLGTLRLIMAAGAGGRSRILPSTPEPSPREASVIPAGAAALRLQPGGHLCDKSIPFLQQHSGKAGPWYFAIARPRAASSLSTFEIFVRFVRW